MKSLFKLDDNMSCGIVILLLGILCGSAFAEKKLCTSDRNCSSLDYCDLKLGFCVASPFGLGVIALVVILVFCVVIAIVVWSCRRHSRRNNFRPHNQYLPQTVITRNAPALNQQQTGVTTTTVYPHNPQPNQFSTDSDNPPAYNKVVGINANQMPSAPPAGYA
ncbi:uncharacterized protein LOC119078027 [Bradysia coprophila]|uniref:uncharacterized protein LOC119078027 n=1 Tax=Bradysia coprophila TaxID=38358 RepID=UPI00187D9754|nr:uncharacterized protein LOC119078027 [Bradysia coprophila]